MGERKQGMSGLKKKTSWKSTAERQCLLSLTGKKDYKIYDKDNRVVETMRGEALYSNHYDKVESSVRKRYEKSQVETETKVKTATKTTTQRKR